MVEVTQADREAAADILDELSSIMDHHGLGQIADLVRDGEYDEHPTAQSLATHRIQSTAALQSELDAAKVEIERLRGALGRAATTGYIVCAETRHVTLGEKVRAAIEALGDSHV